MLLNNINSPEDLKQLPQSQLAALAEEIRQRIIHGVAETGGHLASNLGVVELTIALHREFTTGRDQIVWDVGHQTYAHKLLTGRRDRFSTLRCEGGISGFPKREESCHDAFNTGHSTTSISAAVGLAEALRLQGNPAHVVAVIGDGALTGGMAWEAMNHAADLGKPLIVVLNDNEMSISPNVGAIARYLNTLRTTRLYRQTKQDVRGALEGIGRLGDFMSQWATKFKSSLKYFLIRGIVFEELGFTYLGPVDGHDINGLQKVMRQAKDLNTPVLIHCLTRKGKGYLPAEDKPDQYHSASPFVVATGERAGGKVAPVTFTQVFGDSLVSLAESNDRLVAVTAAMIDGTGLTRFAKSYPHRLYDVGIAEPHAVTFAAGLAAGGMIPVVAIYSTFMQRAYDQIFHDVCLQRLPVVLCLDRAGVVGEDGETHHGIYDISYLRSLPAMTILAASGADDLPFLLKEALALGAPVALRYPRDHAKRQGLPLNREGALISGINPDVLLIGIGPLVAECLAAARILETQGISVGVFYCPQVWPLPQPLKDILPRMRLVVTLEDNVLPGGFGSSIAEELAAMPCCKVVSLGYPHGHVAHAPRSVLLSRAGLTVDAIVEVVKNAH